MSEQMWADEEDSCAEEEAAARANPPIPTTARPVHNHGVDPSCRESLIGDCLRAPTTAQLEALATSWRDFVADPATKEGVGGMMAVGVIKCIDELRDLLAKDK